VQSESGTHPFSYSMSTGVHVWG